MNPFDSSKRRLWCHGPKPEFVRDNDWADQWYIAARTLPLVRPGRDCIVLPRGQSAIMEFAAFCITTLGIGPEQILWTSGRDYLLDDGIRKELMRKIRAIISGNPHEWEIVPYSITKPFLGWFCRLPEGVSPVGDDEKWTKMYSSKTLLHRYAYYQCIPEMRILPEVIPEIRVPRGYACSDQKEITTAHRLLREERVARMILKPAVGATGEGIIPDVTARQIEEYGFPMGDAVLEELLEIDCDERGRQITPSVQYMGRMLYAGVTDQTCNGVTHEGNIAPSRTPLEFQARVREASERILSFLNPLGPGGFDFLSVKGEPVLVDPNVGRFTGAHPPRIFQEMHAPRTHFESWKITPPTMSPERFWRTLKRLGIAFQPGRTTRGVFPLCWLHGMWAMLIAIGKSRDEVARLRAEAEKIL